MKENVEFIDDEVITLYNDANEPVAFHEVACVEYEGDYYALLQPVEAMEGIGEDEAIIFRLVEQPDDESDLFVPVESEEILNAVFEEYLRATADMEDSCGCGCEHDHCDCEHDHCDCEHDDCGCDDCKK